MQGARAREAGVVICGGVGFDVVPTDCVAAAVKAALPDATELALGFQTPLRLSPGTLKAVFPGRNRRSQELPLPPPGSRSPPVQSLLKGLAGRVKGPGGAARARQPTRVWGEARNARGDRVTARIRIANLYTVTATGSLTVTAHLLEQRTAAGAYTPARLLGPELIAQLPGSGPLTVE